MEKNKEHFLVDFKFYEIPAVVPEGTICILEELEQQVHEAMMIPPELLGIYPEKLDFCIIIEKEE